MSPAAMIALVIIPLTLLVSMYTPQYIAIDRNYFKGFALALCLLALSFFVMGALIAKSTFEEGKWRAVPYTVSPACLDLLGVTAIVAYFLWFGALVSHPSLIVEIVSGNKSNVREDFSTLPGITTLVQFGVCYAVVYSINFSARAAMPRRHHVYFAVLAFLAVFRNFVWSERLAIIEFFIPALLFVSCRLNNERRPLLRTALVAAPYILIAMSFVLFSVSEYFRSWKFYESKNVQFIPFMYDRWIGYYYTSLNNGALLISHYIDRIPDYKFTHVLHWFYQLPGIGPWLTRAMDITFDPEKYILDNYLNPEFNVFSGIFPVFYDVGILPGLVFWAATGFIAGWMYAGFVARRGLGYILYPTLFVSLLELMRVEYVFSTRYAYILVGCLLAYAFFRQPLPGLDALRRRRPEVEERQQVVTRFIRS
jgi:hypothetical protein